MRITILALIPALLLQHATVPALAETDPPLKVMKTFMSAFHEARMEDCQAMLARGSIVTITRRMGGKEVTRHQGDATEWLKAVGEQVKPLRDWHWVEHDSHTAMNSLGAVVMLRYESLAKTPGGSFTNDGIDVGSFVLEDGRWKIIQYNMFEDFRWSSSGKDEPDGR